MNILRNITLIFITSVLFVGCHDHQIASINTHNGSVHSHSNINDGFFGEYILADDTFGTYTEVTIRGNNRIVKTNALPNHTTGTFPNSGNPNKISAQHRTYSIPLQPKYRGKAIWVREPGVALNGIKFEPETAEVLVCQSGERYRIEAKQEHFDLGLDHNNAHVQPTGEYHYHGTPMGMLSVFDTGQDLVHIGFAKDGFPIYYSKTNAYKPSFKLAEKLNSGTDCDYRNPHQSQEVTIDGKKPDGTFTSDWEYVEGLGDLDQCNGIEVGGNYMYLVTDSYPFVGRCLMGEFKEDRRKGPPPGHRPPRGERRRRG